MGIFDLRLEWVKEMRDAKVVKAVKIDTTENVADISKFDEVPISMCYR